MATVYLATDVKHDRPVALKVLRDDLAQTLGAERFLREIRIAAQLYHPHILGLIDSGEEAGRLYYVMPYVAGESLRNKLDREGELPVAEGVRILREIADALAYAHGHGVVHRDIKPGNVLLAGRHALVADFGVAKAVTAAADVGTLTSAGIAIGTPTYMAPEQAAADPHLDHRADIYALGVLAYEMFAGEPPFTGGNAQKILSAHLTSTPKQLSEMRPALRPELVSLVMKCLAKRPADRWQSAAELLPLLDAITENTDSRSAMRHAPVNVTQEGTFRLSESVCRKLNRAALDPRMIGDDIHYLDNQVESDVLVVYLHALGLDQTAFEPILRLSSYRGLSLTLYGFEPTARRRIRLSLDDHAALVRECLRDAIARLRPAITILVAFSSAGDLGFRVLDTPPTEPPVTVDGFLPLSCNLNLETCFVTGVLSRMSVDRPEDLLADLNMIDSKAWTLDNWLNVHEYLVRIFRKFHDDIGVLQQFSKEIVRPFEEPGETTFADWYRMASQRVRCLRCVFEELGAGGTAVQKLRLQNLDTGILGDRYREDSIISETGAAHFDLMNPDRVLRHVDEMVAILRSGKLRH